MELVQYYLKERKFLLVLNNVWTMEAWMTILVVLSKSNYISKVIIISRKKSVGDKTSQPRESSELPFLKDSQR